MAVTTTLRFGLTQWSAGTDPYRRSHVNTSFNNIEIKTLGYLQGVGVPSVAPELEGFLFFDTDVNALSYCDGIQWWLIVAGEGGFGSPAALSIATTASDEGIATTASRADHQHPMPGFANPIAIGTSLGAGSGGPLARANHVHIVGNGAINSASQIAVNAVGNAALATNAVTSDKISSTDSSDLATNSVSTGKLQDGSITTEKLTDGAVTNDKLGSFDASKVDTGVFDAARIPDLDASKITSGVVPSTQLPVGTYIPPGVVMMFTDITAPQLSGTWLLCDGSAVSRTTYPKLHDVLSAAGYPFGSGDGSTTFHLPGATGRFPLFGTLGASGGSFDHVHTGSTHTHSLNPPNTSTDTDPSHTHTQGNVNSTGSHSHSVSSDTGNASVGSGFASSATEGLVSKDDIDHSHSHSHSDGSYGTSSYPDPFHSHSVSGTSSTSTPSYSTSRAHQHDHSMPTSGTESSHNHNMSTTGSGGSHNHDLDISSFNSGNGSSNGATDASSVANGPFLAITFYIKT